MNTKTNLSILAAVLCMGLTACTKKENGNAAPTALAATDSVETATVEAEPADDDELVAIEDVDWEEIAMGKEFLSEMHTSSEIDICDEEWIKAHCTPEMARMLRDYYDYDGGPYQDEEGEYGYATWYMLGSVGGEAEYETQIFGIGYGLRKGEPVYEVTKAYGGDGNWLFTRTLYYGLKRNGDDFIITSFDYRHTDDPENHVCFHDEPIRQ